MCPTQLNSDQHWMQRALDLAARVRGHVWPNPPVGCVVVKDGAHVSEAATHPGGRPHAERKALDLAGAEARGATLYVTLEPCCHWGKTPPCADAIIESQIARVVCAIQDPDPRVNGGGFAALQKAGLHVDIGLGAHAAERVMSGFFHRVRTGTPEFVRASQAWGGIPDGADARLASSPEGAVLTERTGATKHFDPASTLLPTTLGDLGLTSVAIPHGDALWESFGAAQSRDESAPVRDKHGAWA